MARQEQGRPKKQAGTGRTARSSPTKEMTEINASSAKGASPASGRATADLQGQTTPKAKAARTVTFQGESSQEAIRRRAYEIYLERKGQPGDPVNDWLQAERELKSTAADPVRGRRRK